MHPAQTSTPYRGRPPVIAPVDNTEILSKLEKLVPELSNSDKFIANAKTFNDLLNRGLNKQTAANFYVALETLSGHIGKEEFNSVAVWRIFEYAFLKKFMFNGTPAHLENITKWKTAADLLIKPKGTIAPATNLARKHLLDNPAGGNKRARTAPFIKNYNVVDVGQQVEVLQEELVAVKEELKALRDDHKREVDFLYQHLGISPPAPPTPEPEPEPEPEVEPETAETTETTETAETAETAETTETAETAAAAETTETAEGTENAEAAETAETAAEAKTDADMGEANGEQ